MSRMFKLTCLFVVFKVVLMHDGLSERSPLRLNYSVINREEIGEENNKANSGHGEIPIEVITQASSASSQDHVLLTTLLESSLEVAKAQSSLPVNLKDNKPEEISRLNPIKYKMIEQPSNQTTTFDDHQKSSDVSNDLGGDCSDTDASNPDDLGGETLGRTGTDSVRGRGNHTFGYYSLQNESLSSRSRLACQCGSPEQTRIVGGSFTKIENHPWVVQILSSINHFPFCGGSIINDLYILTAAHCMEGARPSKIRVRVGHTKPSNPGVIIGVSAIKRHERYRPKDITKFDIALIRLKRRLTFTNKVMPICLGRKRKTYNRRRGGIAGWGAVSELGPVSAALKQSEVIMFEAKLCRRISLYNPSQIHRRVICGRKRGTDSCQGDSGGPLIDKTGNKFFLIGVTSWGYGCARFKYPGVYTKVPTYLRWIRKWARSGRYCGQ